MNTKKEEWRPLDICKDYEVSSYGRVRSVTRTISYRSAASDKIIQRTMPGKVLKHNINKVDGHHRVPIVLPVGDSPGSTKLRLLDVGRLVATAFLNTSDGAKSVKYKDGNLDNLHVDNLEWNAAGHPQARAIIDHTARCEYPSITAASKVFGVDHSTIVDCIAKGRDVAGHQLTWKSPQS